MEGDHDEEEKLDGLQDIISTMGAANTATVSEPAVATNPDETSV